MMQDLFGLKKQFLPYLHNWKESTESRPGNFF